MRARVRTDQDPADHGDLKSRRDDVEEDGGKNEGDSPERVEQRRERKGSASLGSSSPTRLSVTSIRNDKKKSELTWFLDQWLSSTHRSAW